MESYVYQNGPSRHHLMMSTLESDDATFESAPTHSSFNGRYDSGIHSMSDSLRSGTFSMNRTLDSATNLEDQLNRLSIWEKQQETAHSGELESFHQEFNPYQFAAQQGSTMINTELVPVSVPVTTNEMVPLEQQATTCNWTFYDHVRRTIDPFEQDEDGDTQLHLAIIQPNPSAAFRLIEAGQFTDRLDMQNDHQQTPLHLAVITDQPQLVRALVLSGASLMVRDKQGNIPLHLACKLGNAQCVEQLTMPPNEGEQQYIWTERQKKGLPPKMMNFMLSSDVSLLNYEGDTCLHLALSSAAETKILILNYLLNTRGADINAQEGKCGFTLLHQAVRSRDLQAVQFLLAHRNTSVNQRCYNGYTPLDFAISQHHDQLADLLTRYGGISFIGISSPEAEVSQEIDFDDLVVGGGFYPESLRR